MPGCRVQCTFETPLFSEHWKRLNEFQRLTFPGPKNIENFPKAALTKTNKEKFAQPTSLTFGLVSDWPEKCGKPLAAVISRCLFITPLYATPGPIKSLLLKKSHLGKRASFHII